MTDQLLWQRQVLLPEDARGPQFTCSIFMSINIEKWKDFMKNRVETYLSSCYSYWKIKRWTGEWAFKQIHWMLCFMETHSSLAGSSQIMMNYENCVLDGALSNLAQWVSPLPVAGRLEQIDP